MSYKTNRELEFQILIANFPLEKIYMCRKNCKMKCSWQNFTSHFNLEKSNNICRIQNLQFQMLTANDI